MVRCPPSDCFPGRAFQIARYYCRPTRLVVGLTATSVLPHRAMGQWIAEQLADGEVDSRYPLTKLECPLVERASVDKPRD